MHIKFDKIYIFSAEELHRGGRLGRLTGESEAYPQNRWNRDFHKMP